MGYEVYTYRHEYEKVIYGVVVDLGGDHTFWLRAGR